PAAAVQRWFSREGRGGDHRGECDTARPAHGDNGCRVWLSGQPAGEHSASGTGHRFRSGCRCHRTVAQWARRCFARRIVSERRGVSRRRSVSRRDRVTGWRQVPELRRSAGMADTQRPYPQGTPCWLDMYADDQDAALRFYHELFGWTGEPNPRREGYAVLSLDGKAVAGIGPKMRGMPGRTVAWSLYFAIDDVETAAERITKLGGILYFGPADVPQVGRQLLAADPASAPFGLWQAAPFPGFEARMQPGTPVWFELDTPQGPHSADFYGALLGVEVPKTPMEPDSYWVLMVNGEQAAGIWQAGHTADSPQGAEFSVIASPA